MLLGGRTRSPIGHIRLKNGRIWDLRLERLHHIPRQDIRPVRLARVELDAHLAPYRAIYLPVKLLKMVGINMPGEIDLRLACAVRTSSRGSWSHALCL